VGARGAGAVRERRFMGRADGRFPWPFFGAPVLAGREPAEAELDDAGRVELGAALGRFLRGLHAPEGRAAVDPEGVLPVDFNRRADATVRVPRARENLAYLRDSELWTSPAVEPILTAAEELPPAAGDLVLAHGDLHQRHVLVEGDEIAAVIDWGDVCLADPCIDLILVWSLLTPP